MQMQCTALAIWLWAIRYWLNKSLPAAGSWVYPELSVFRQLLTALMCYTCMSFPSSDLQVHFQPQPWHSTASHFQPPGRRLKKKKKNLFCFSADGMFYVRNNPAESLLHGLNKNELSCPSVVICVRNVLCCGKKRQLVMGVSELWVLG